MSEAKRSQVSKFEANNKAMLERKAKRAFKQAVRGSGGLVIRQDGTLSYLDNLEF